MKLPSLKEPNKNSEQHFAVFRIGIMGSHSNRTKGREQSCFLPFLLSLHPRAPQNSAGKGKVQSPAALSPVVPTFLALPLWTTTEGVPFKISLAKKTPVSLPGGRNRGFRVYTPCWSYCGLLRSGEKLVLSQRVQEDKAIATKEKDFSTAVLLLTILGP